MAVAAPLVAVAGPTGSGKSDLAIRIAQQCGGEIVNYDSVQVFRGFDIGSAKVPAAERGGIPHHLIDIRDPAELFTAGDFIREATRAIEGISGLPVLCGGTGFYLRALLRGVSEAPPRDESLRAALQRREERRPGSLHRLLRRLDPDAGRRIHANDGNKTIRALEIRILSGRPASAHFEQHPPLPLPGYRFLILGLDPPREQLYARLNERCERMWPGMLAEVRLLLEQGVPREAKPFESLGYKQALQFLCEGQSEAAALEEMKVRTRQYAKRQWTWFRAEPGVEWLPGFGSSQAVQQQALEKVTRFNQKSE